MTDMDSSNPEYAKMQAKFKVEDAFFDKLKRFKKLDLLFILRDIGITLTKSHTLKKMKEIATENRKRIVKNLNRSLEDSICDWNFIGKCWKTEEEIEGWVVAKPYVESEQQDDTPSQAASSCVAAPEDKYPQYGHEGFRTYWYDSDEERKEAEAKEKHSELRKEWLIAKCTCCQCQQTDSKGEMDDTNGKFYCCKCPRQNYKTKTAEVNKEEKSAADCLASQEVVRQNYSIVRSTSPSPSPSASAAAEASGETTDDEKVNSSTTGKAPATDSVGNAGIELKREPGETSSTPRLENRSTSEKGRKPNEVVFSVFSGLFAGIAGKRSTTEAPEGPSAKAQEDPSKTKKQREEPSWLNSEKEPKKTPQKTTPAKGSEWESLLATELHDICVKLKFQPGSATRPELIGMLKNELKEFVNKPGYGVRHESGCHHAKNKRAGRKGKLVFLNEYLECCTQGGKDSKWNFQYDDEIVTQKKPEVELVVKKAFPVSTSVTAIPMNARKRPESHENGAASHAYEAGASRGDKRPKWEAPISQQHSEASEESQDDASQASQAGASQASQSLDIEAGASQASQSLYVQQHNPSGDYNNPVGDSTWSSMRGTMNWAN